MNKTHSPLSNSAMTSHQVTQLMNADILIYIEALSVYQYVVDGIDDLHNV